MSLQAGPECLLGNSLCVKVAHYQAQSEHWIGVYRQSTLSAPDTNWIYLPSRQDDGAQSEITVTIPPSKLPSHGGLFELRLHRGDGNATTEASCQVLFVPRRRSPIRVALLLTMLLIIVAVFQTLLNGKGECTYLSPATYEDPIEDYFVVATASANAYLASHLHMAGLLQALCSASLDASMVTLILVVGVQRGPLKPFLALFIFMVLRFVAQAAATVPCAPGFLWPRGEAFGIAVPTIFVDYHPANDMFFSGHAGTILIAGLQFWEMGFVRTAMFHLLVMLPLASTLVVCFRAHRGIDIIAAVLAAFMACGCAEKVSVAVDQALLEAPDTQTHNVKAE